MTENNKHLHQRATRILWAITCGYGCEIIIGQDEKRVTIVSDVINDVYTFSDDGKVYSYRQAHNRIMAILNAD